MKILVLYATNSGGTLFAAEEVVKVCNENHHQATLVRADQFIDFSQLQSYDLVIFGSNTWNYNKKEGQPHIWYLEMEKKLQEPEVAALFVNKKCATFVLGDSSYAKFGESADYLENMIKQLQGELIGESLRIDKFYHDETGSLKKVHEWISGLLVSTLSNE